MEEALETELRVFDEYCQAAKDAHGRQRIVSNGLLSVRHMQTGIGPGAVISANLHVMNYCIIKIDNIYFGITTSTGNHTNEDFFFPNVLMPSGVRKTRRRYL